MILLTYRQYCSHHKFSVHRSVFSKLLPQQYNKTFDLIWSSFVQLRYPSCLSHCFHNIDASRILCNRLRYIVFMGVVIPVCILYQQPHSTCSDLLNYSLNNGASSVLSSSYKHTFQDLSWYLLSSIQNYIIGNECEKWTKFATLWTFLELY
jgi:hypothetical protein